jgi:translation initiation factor 2B subunit (eIF-2B alpha/beta/delta family)
MDFIQEIRNDNRSGASEIARKVADFLARFADTFPGTTRSAFMEELIALCHGVASAQPVMAPLFNLVNRVLLRAEAAKGFQDCTSAVKEAAFGFLQTTSEAWRAIADGADGVVREGATILVHSSSATICRTLLSLRDRRRAFSVIASESRPVREGVQMGRMLAEKGIEVRLIVDAAAFQLLHRVDLVFVGADTVSPRGIVNKIGTRGLALGARYEGVPFYVLTGTEKYLPRDVPIEKLENEARPPVEVLDERQPMGVLNFYFDFTPMDLISGLITERGMTDAARLEHLFREFPIHPSLPPVALCLRAVAGKRGNL